MPRGLSTVSRIISSNGRFNTSVISNWTSVTPPPEYLNAVSGGRATMTLPTLDGGAPSRICTSVGTGAPGLYPGNPNPSSVPEVWLSRPRNVTGCLAVASLAGTFHDVRIVLTS